MTVWNDASYTERLAHANWMANTAILMHLNERATGDPARDWLSSWAHRWFVGDGLRVLVLGCGEGWLERAVAAWPFVAHIDAVDSAEDAVRRASEAARGLRKIAYEVVDLNRVELQRESYDVVVAHSVLHHVENLEHAFEQIERCMRPNATLLVNEYVGPKRFQFGHDMLGAMNALFSCIPAELRGHASVVRRPDAAEMIANDPTEAVRSDEVVPMIEERFEVLERKAIGGTLLQHLLYEVVANFHFDRPRDRSLLEMLCTIEGMLIDEGRIPCDFAILAARKRGATVKRMPRPLPPRPRAAAEIEPDPLRFSPPRGVVTPSGGNDQPLRPYHLRLLRQALLSGKPRRSNLFEESPLLSLRERWASRGSDAWEWVIARSPDDEAVRCLVRTASSMMRP